MAKDRVIFHCDCNSFYASVELLHHPQLRNVPMAVCGDPEQRRGVILAKNEAAKRLGVRTAQSVYEALRICPKLALVPPHHREYRRFSRQINAIYAQYTDRVEPFGIDESWLDMTGTWHLFGPSPAAVADLLRARVKAETGLTISVGVSFNKVFAKLGSDYRKPDATTVILQQDVARIVWPLPADALLYVGPATRRKLLSRNIRTIGDIAARQPQTLRAMLGKHGETLWRYANGLESAPVAPWGAVTEIKSIGNSITPARDLVSDADARELLAVLCPCVAERLLRHGLEGRVVTVSIRDDALKTISVQQTLPAPTALSGEIEDAARRLFFQHWNWTRRVRSLGVCVSGLSMQGASGQLSMWEGARDRALALDRTLLALRRRYGRECVRRALLLNSDFGRLRPHEDLPAFVRSHSPQGA